MVANSVAIAPGLSRPLLGALEKSFDLGIAPSAFADQKKACLSQSDSNFPGSRPNLMHFAQNIVDWLVNNVYGVAMPRTRPSIQSSWISTVSARISRRQLS